MKIKTIDYIDFEKVNKLLDDFSKFTGFVSAILDLEGNVLSKSGWRNVCKDFHRKNEDTSNLCRESDTLLANKCLECGYNLYTCKNGLTDVSVPLIIKGEHIANLFTGQFFLENPDIAFFTKQASKYGFPLKSYLKAISEVPVFTKDRVKEAINYLYNITEIIIDLTTDKLKQENTKLLLQSSLESPVDIIILAIDKDYKYLYFNNNHYKTMKTFYGSNVSVGDNHLDKITEKTNRIMAKINYEKAFSGTSHTIVQEWGEEIKKYFESSYYPIYNKGEVIGVSVFAKDITARIEKQNLLIESEEKYRLLYSSMSQGLALYEVVPATDNFPLTYKFIDVNDSYLKLFGVKKEDIIDKKITEVNSDLENAWLEYFTEVSENNKTKYIEKYSIKSHKYFSAYIYSPKKGQCAVLFTDITERFEKEKEIEYLSYYDQLTGIYNRRFYEKEIVRLDNDENLPISLIMGDVNGLKLVNDSFGHVLGDELLIKVAKILKEGSRDTDVVSRIGGDEFVLILPKTNKKESEEVIHSINMLLSKETINDLNISISFGNATKTTTDQKLSDIFKIIEDNMYRKKLNEGASMRSKTLDLIMTTLFEKNEREMVHSKRVSKLSGELAKELGYNNDFISQMQTAGLMHDIGKIAIKETILNKEGKLTNEEWTEVKRHCEVGYRILSSLNEFSDIADFILAHHERWDGKGYPKGLVGEEISVQSRIINIADAYDAMTSIRTYKKEMSKDEAIEELKRCSGTQFDPNIVDVFVEKVLINK